MHLRPTVIILALLAQATFADGPADNHPQNVRPVPPVGIELPEADRLFLETELTRLNEKIANLKRRRDARTPLYLPDVEIFARAIRDGLAHRELYSAKDITGAKEILQIGLDRADHLLAGEVPWTKQKGLVVRGYRSKIDQTVQPYGLLIPESYDYSGREAFRLDLWFHGRGERSTESVFIAERLKRVGRIAPRDTIVLHPYGRYSNAFKFAGEVDVLEALEHAKNQYRIDPHRIAVRGFSMGGAGCWQMAVHYPDLFFAATPGAGFSETPEFLKSFQQESLDPTWYERKLWQLYDCPPYTINLFNLPVIAYSGEFDAQKQAADVMEAAYQREGMRLTHIIGPETKHAIHPDSLQIIESKLEQLAARRPARIPKEVRFATPTLKYNRQHWLTVTAMDEHWTMARIRAQLKPQRNQVTLDLRNVAAVQLEIPPGQNPFQLDQGVDVIIREEHFGQQTVQVQPPSSDRSWRAELRRVDGTWQLGQPDTGLRKKHDLQGPIDDAFMDSFVVVRPSAKASHDKVEAWTQAELQHFVSEWRRQFRGDAVTLFDHEVTEQTMAASNLILFGDPASNTIIERVLPKLPITWNKQQIMLGDRTWDASRFAPVMIYPNPLNPERYIVLNSGFTYREYAYLNNARQVPKLPDWAIVDLSVPPDSLWPGRIDSADFFDEQWQIKSEK